MKSKKILLALSALVLLASCSTTPIGPSTSEPGSSNITSSDSTSEPTSESSSNDPTTDSSSIYEPAVSYKLVASISSTTFNVDDTLNFSDVSVSLTTYEDEVEKTTKTLSRSEYKVTVGNEVVTGDSYTFNTKGKLVFVFTSVDQPSASTELEVSVQAAYYTITNASSDKIDVVGVPEKAEAGDNISFSVYLVPGYYLDGDIAVKTTAGENVTYSLSDDIYSFVMPKSNVTISVETALVDYKISYDTDLIEQVFVKDGEILTPVKSACAGQEVVFSIKESEDYVYSKVMLDGNVLSKGETDEYYSFTMPHHPVSITTDKKAKTYAITYNSEDLTVTTVTIYTNDETKENITSASKGQLVHVVFSYSVSKVGYEVDANDANDNKIEVTKVSDTEFTFVMVSSAVTLKIKEENYSKYNGFHVVDKVWNYKNDYSQSNRKSTYDETTLSSNTLTFLGNGKLNKGTSLTYDWTTESKQGDTTGKVSIATSSTNTKTLWFSEYLIITSDNWSTEENSIWNDLDIGTYVGANVNVNILTFEEKYRVIYVTEKDGDGTILDTAVTYNNQVMTNASVYVDQEHETLAKDSDLTTSSTYYVVAGEYSFKVAACKMVMNYNITAEATEQYSLNVTNEEGNVITQAENGSKVKVKVSLLGDNEDLEVSGIAVRNTTSSANVTSTAVEGEDDTFSFTMPSGDVTITATIKDNGFMKGHVALGSYYGFNMFYNSNFDGVNRNYTSTSSMKKYSLSADGSFNFDGASQTVSEFTTTPRGTFKAATRTWNYGDDLIITPYGSSYNDLYVGLKVGPNETFTKFETKGHYISNICICAEFYLNDELVTGLFVSNEGEVLTGVTFTLAGGTTSLKDSNPSYTISLDGVVLYTVSDGTLTAVNAGNE